VAPRPQQLVPIRRCVSQSVSGQCVISKLPYALVQPHISTFNHATSPKNNNNPYSPCWEGLPRLRQVERPWNHHVSSNLFSTSSTGTSGRSATNKSINPDEAVAYGTAVPVPEILELSSKIFRIPCERQFTNNAFKVLSFYFFLSVYSMMILSRQTQVTIST
jgi:hypothetical protein